jgi:hypothetical protein
MRQLKPVADAILPFVHSDFQRLARARGIVSIAGAMQRGGLFHRPSS